MKAERFTSLPILSALGSAKERGLDVALIRDKSNDRSGEMSRYSVVTRAGIPVLNGAHHTSKGGPVRQTVAGDLGGATC